MADILVIAASDGNNLELAELFSSTGSKMGHEMSVLELGSLDLPLFTPQLLSTAGAPAGLATLEGEMSQADGWVVCAPEYNGSMPPTLNNAIAWLSTEGSDFRSLFNATPVALATYSGGGGTNVIAAMRMQFSYLGSNVIGRSVVANSNKAANPEAVTALIEQLVTMS